MDYIASLTQFVFRHKTTFDELNIISRIDVETYQTQARYFKVLMHPIRLALLDILRRGEECVCHMQAQSWAHS